MSETEPIRTTEQRLPKELSGDEISQAALVLAKALGSIRWTDKGTGFTPDQIQKLHDDGRLEEMSAGVADIYSGMETVSNDVMNDKISPVFMNQYVVDGLRKVLTALFDPAFVDHRSDSSED